MSTNKVHPVALIGVGRIGAIHFKNILNNHDLSLKWVIDVNEKAAQEFASKVPGCQASSSTTKMLEDASIEGVIICSPTAEHTKAILDCLRAGKAVMCEKPISLNLEDIDLCYNESKRLNIPLLCAYQRRHDESFAKARQTINNGSIGKVQIVRSTSRDHPLPTLNFLKISGKIFHDCTSHDIDMVRWLTGEDPCEVFAFGSAFRSEIASLHDWDTVTINLKFPSGVLATIDVSRFAAYGYDQRIEIHGDQGMVQAFNQQPTSCVVSTHEGVKSDPYFHSFPQRYEKTYATELAHFVRVIRRETEPMVNHDDIKKVTIIASAAERSCETGAPIKLTY